MPDVRSYLIAMWLLAWGGMALPAWADAVSEDPLERQMLEIAKDLRCAVCQNQPVSESNSDLAMDMRAIIREKLEAGQSRDDIVDYFVQRYGDYVLMKPPYQGSGTVLWLLPVLLLGGLGAFAFVYLRNRAHHLLPPPPTLSEADRARIRAEREDYDA